MCVFDCPGGTLYPLLSPHASHCWGDMGISIYVGALVRQCVNSHLGKIERGLYWLEMSTLYAFVISYSHLLQDLSILKPKDQFWKYPLSWSYIWPCTNKIYFTFYPEIKGFC